METTRWRLPLRHGNWNKSASICFWYCGQQARRLLALAAIYDGATRTEAAWRCDSLNHPGLGDAVQRTGCSHAVFSSIRIVNSNQLYHYPAAAEMPRTQPGRKYLPVRARQLAFEPRLQILRRYSRSLLLCLECTPRPPLENYFHRAMPMGARVLINKTWYYF